VAVFVVVNLFIAVVINNLEAAKLEQQADVDRRSPYHALLSAIEDIRGRLEDMERHLREASQPATPTDGSLPSKHANRSPLT
jgi:hypothetical protein